MIDVTSQWWNAIVIAAICGAVGGLVYELVIERLGDSGMIELFKMPKGKPGTNDQRRYLDLGFVASILVGVVAAVGFLFFMRPDTREVVGSAPKTFREYDPFRLIAGCLIVGTSGVSFVKAMRDKLLNAINKSQLDVLRESAKAIADKGRADLGNASAEGAAVSGQLDALAVMAEKSVGA